MNRAVIADENEPRGEYPDGPTDELRFPVDELKDPMTGGVMNTKIRRRPFRWF